MRALLLNSQEEFACTLGLYQDLEYGFDAADALLQHEDPIEVDFRAPHVVVIWQYKCPIKEAGNIPFQWLTEIRVFLRYLEQTDCQLRFHHHLYTNHTVARYICSDVLTHETIFSISMRWKSFKAARISVSISSLAQSSSIAS